MKTITYLFLFSSLWLFSCQTTTTPSTDAGEPAAVEIESPRDGIFIHLSAGEENAHRVLMAFKLAEVMSADKDVLMYLDIEAVNLVVNGAPDISKEGFPSSLEQIKKLIDLGVIIQACPTCLKVAGYTQEDLQEGVILANKELFFNFTQGKILSIDY